MKFLKKLATTRARKYFYRLLLAVIPILIFYGIIQEEIAPQIIALLGALFGFSVADFNTPKEGKEEPEDYVVI